MEPSREETRTMLPKAPTIRTVISPSSSSSPSQYLTTPSSDPQSKSESESEAEAEPRLEPTKPSKRPTRTWKTNIALISSILLLILTGLILSIVHYTRQSQGIITPHVIGGRLTTIQAKTIDFLCAAIFAPVVMLLLDNIWFSNARNSVLNERQSPRSANAGMPLPSVVEASITSAGGFDLLKLRTLIRGKTWRLYMLCMLVLLSGTASKALANFIAYEAYDVQTERAQYARLRLLSNPYLSSPIFLNNHELHVSDLPFSIPQKADLANQMTALLTGLRFQSAAAKLDDSGAYIGSNATDASLNALDRSVVRLANVPAYQLTTTCQTAQPETLITVAAGTSFRITPMFPDIYQSVIPGTDTIANPSGYSEINKYIAFSVNGSHAYLGNLDNRPNNSTMPSEYGAVVPKVFNMTLAYGFANYTNWGVRCDILRQEGFVNYTRDAVGTGTGTGTGSETETESGIGLGSWRITATSFNQNKTVIPAPLKPWQFALDYHAPQSTIAGIGAATGATAGPDFVTGINAQSLTVDWETYALNYLYASAQAQRVGFEVAAGNATNGNRTGTINETMSNLIDDYWYTVDATTTGQKYRITYIPLLLILGLVCALAAAGLTGGMLVYTRDSEVRSAREVNALRLVVDGVVGLQEEAGEMGVVASLKQEELEEWAGGFRVRYVEVVEREPEREREEEGRRGVVVRLVKAGS